MAIATLQSLKTALKKLKLVEMSDPKKMDGHFLAPKSAAGKEFIIYLPEQYSKKDRSVFLEKTLAPGLKDLNPKFDARSSKSTAGALLFQGSQIYIIAKLLAAKGGGGNKGIDFEKNLENDFKQLIQDKSNFMYKDFIYSFIEDIKPDRVVRIEAVGGLNTPRPLAVSGGKLYVSVRGGPRNENIGSGLADLVVHTQKGKKIPLSLKYGSTVTFFNSGVGRIFDADSFKKGDFSKNEISQALIDLFGIDPIRFRNVFMNYTAPDPLAKKGKSEKDEVIVKLTSQKKRDLVSLLRTVIGQGYVLVHEHNDHSVSHYNIDAKFLDKASNIISDLTVLYPKGGSAKRIDIKLETEIFHLNFNIRNKQGGILPSHIMCDYKIKHH
jgi:hypothetical protein